MLFTDLDSGPVGTPVTLWVRGPVNSVQYVDVNGTTHDIEIYYSTKADGTKGPANLYWALGGAYEAVVFMPQIPLGEGKFVVNGTFEAPFTIREGDVYTVSESGDGDFTNLYHVVDASRGLISAGDVIVVKDFTQNGPLRIGWNTTTGYTGTKEMPFSLVAHPDYNFYLQGDAGNAPVSNKYGLNHYWNFSKIHFDGLQTLLPPFKGMRTVGCKFTGTKATGYAGAIAGPNSNMVGQPAENMPCQDLHIQGCEFDHFGDIDTSQGEHVFYITNRSGETVLPYKATHCYLHDCGANCGFHVYDQGLAGGWSGTIEFEDSVVVDQAGSAMNIVGYASDGILPYNFAGRRNIVITNSTVPNYQWDGIGISVTGNHQGVDVVDGLIVIGWTADAVKFTFPSNDHELHLNNVTLVDRGFGETFFNGEAPDTSNEMFIASVDPAQAPELPSWLTGPVNEIDSAFIDSLLTGDVLLPFDELNNAIRTGVVPEPPIEPPVEPPVCPNCLTKEDLITALQAAIDALSN